MKKNNNKNLLLFFLTVQHNDIALTLSVNLLSHQIDRMYLEHHHPLYTSDSPLREVHYMGFDCSTSFFGVVGLCSS